MASPTVPPAPAAGSTHDAAFLQEVLDHVGDGVYFVDRNRRITYWNQGAERISGFSAGEVVGRCCNDNLLNHVDGTGCQLCLDGCPLTATIRSGCPSEAQVFLRHRAGHRVPVLVRVAPIRDATGAVTGAVESFADISSELASKRKLATLQREVLTDPLTQLGNRHLFDSRAETCIRELSLGIPCGAIFLDLDHFKRVNDAWGHGIGDLMLQMVARTIQGNVRSEDAVVRYGGEEFVVLMQAVNRTQLDQKARMLRALIERSVMQVPDGELRITVSVGATMARAVDTVESWLSRADQGLYQSKDRGRNRVTVID